MYLNIRSRALIVSLGVIAAIMLALPGFRVFGLTDAKTGLYSELFGAVVGGVVALISVNIPVRPGEKVEPWLRHERLAWTLIGLGVLIWGMGEVIEAFYRYNLLPGQNLFPSFADLGYASLPPLVFAGLLLQPSSGSRRVRFFATLDSLIATGATLAIVWCLLLGREAVDAGETNLTKFFSFYYPITDIALLSCVIFLLLRGRGHIYQTNARRMGLVVIGIGLCLFIISDFNFNLQEDLGTYVDGTWMDLGWPLGLMTIALAAHLRRFIPATSGELVERRVRESEERVTLGLTQFIPYFLVGILFLVLVINVFSSDPIQKWDRPVLLLAIIGVVALVIFRQLLTQLENERLAHKQTIALEHLSTVRVRVEEQANMIAEYNMSLEEGIAHLKEVQTQLANGNLRARARINKGKLASLAGNLNIMADRLLGFEQEGQRAQKLERALDDLSAAFENYRASGHFFLPLSCNEFPEIHRLLLSMGLQYTQAIPRRDHSPITSPYPESELLPRQIVGIPLQRGDYLSESSRNRSNTEALPSYDVPQEPLLDWRDR
ncbi:MAG TPA: hypothetical protein VFV38_25430 [Ktedonobacteraceae bacterium]|nr:hypothetical protein [Ktedonobacteraceae bacterium]